MREMVDRRMSGWVGINGRRIDGMIMLEMSTKRLGM